MSFWNNKNVVRIVGLGKIAFGVTMSFASASIPLAAAIATVAITATIAQKYDSKIGWRENAKNILQSFNTYVGAAIAIMVPAIAAGVFVGDAMQKIITGQGGYFAAGGVIGAAAVAAAVPIATIAAGAIVASGVYNVVTGKESHVVEPLISATKFVGKPFLQLLGIGRNEPIITPNQINTPPIKEAIDNINPKAYEEAKVAALDHSKHKYDLNQAPKNITDIKDKAQVQK